MKVVRVKGLKEYTVGKKLYRYHRLSGTPISPDLDDQALAAEVDRLDKLHAPLKAVAGTLRVMVIDYKARSEHWEKLRPRTKKDYERVFAWLGASMDHGLVKFKTETIVGLRDKAKKQHGFKFANQLVITLRMVFAFGAQYGHVAANPTREVEQATRPDNLPEANRPWMPQEGRTMLAGLSYPLLAPVAMAAYLGIREGDVIAMSRKAYADKLITFTTSKTRRMLELPVCPDLAIILDESLRQRAAYFKRMKRTDSAMTLFVNSRGEPWTEDGFKTSFGKARNKLLEAKVIEPGLTFHGARHGAATILAEEGFDEAKFKHFLGHGSETITEHYSRRAKRRKMLLEMAEAIQRSYQDAQGNVLAFDQKANEIV